MVCIALRMCYVILISVIRATDEWKAGKLSGEIVPLSVSSYFECMFAACIDGH